MRVSLEWLKDYVDIEMSPAELADALSMSGTAVDRVLTLGGGVAEVIVAEVLEVKPHPAADTLRIAVVNDGATVREIVCGAPNLAAGMKSPLALEGATLPALSEEPVKKARIRGVESDGMLVSAAELGISEDHTGILELAREAVVGSDVHGVLPLEDIVLELEVTPNRPDCMCVVGVAREVAALTGAPLRMPPIELEETGPDAKGLARVIIEDPEGCPRYTARVVMGALTAPSPAWMQRRLTAAGLRPISNVVDVTNYVLLEVGQPLHAFDLELLGEHTIVVRRARRAEQIRTLDGVDRQLDDQSLVIADAKDPVALAGVIGGQDSEVTPSSTNILIESAHFDPTSILLTSKRLGVRTEASARFERGVDPSGTSFAAARAARLMAELAGGKVASGEIDVYPKVIEPVTLDLRPERTNAVLGISLEAGRMASILESLGARVETGVRLTVTVPTYRRDLEREIDLIEEVARIHGYDRIPSTVPRGGGFSSGLTADQRLAHRLSGALVSQGLSQVVNYAFMRPGDLDLLRLVPGDRRRSLVMLLNPLAETGEAMRSTMLPGMLRTAASNVNRGNRDLALFESGRAFISQGETELPHETDTHALLLVGDYFPGGWSEPARPADFFDMKGIVENLSSRARAVGLIFEVSDEPFLAPGRAASVMVGGRKAGYIGQLHPAVASAFDLEGEFYVAEIESEALLSASKPGVYAPVGRFPNVKVDIAVVVAESLEAKAVEDIIRSSGGDLLRSVRLFDLYRGPQVGEGNKSLAYALEFGSPESTLTDEQAHAELDRVIEALHRELGASIRGRKREGDGP